MQVETIETPAERRRQKVRELILTAAERVFANEGADGLSIRRLAQNIDYSPAAIYKYFGSKDELMFELKEAFFGKILENVHRMADTSRPYAERARDCVGTYVRVAIEKPHHYAAAFTGPMPDDGPSEDQAGFEDTNKGLAFAVLKIMVEEGIEDGHLRRDLDASLAAKSIWASMHGLAMMLGHAPTFPALTTNSNTVSPDAFIDIHADLIVRGLEASR